MPSKGLDPAHPLSPLVDATVRGPDGEALGVVDELLVDLTSGRIEYVVVAGPGGRRLQLPWQSVRVDAAGFRFRGEPRDLVVDGDGHDD